MEVEGFWRCMVGGAGWKTWRIRVGRSLGWVGGGRWPRVKGEGTGWGDLAGFVNVPPPRPLRRVGRID